MSRQFPYELGRSMSILVRSSLIDEYEVDMGGKTQPSVNINDLLYTAYHLLAVCDIAFPTFRTLCQLNTPRKLMTSTSARPGTLVESSGYMKGNDSLKWKDIELYMVKHPEDPKCQVLLMRVKHRLNKGKRNKGVLPVVTYTERKDNLGLCVIQDILEYAFLDNAFASEHIKCPRGIWRLTNTQSAFMETPARDALLKLASNASLTRDTSVPQHLSDAQKQCIEMDQELNQFKRARNALRHDLIAEFQSTQG